MVDPSHSPDESPPEGLTPEAGAENDLTAPLSPLGNAELESDDPEADHRTGLSLEAQSEDEGPDDSVEALTDLAVNADDAADSMPEPEAAPSDPVPEEERSDPIAVESEMAGSISDSDSMESADGFAADSWQPSPENARTDAAEDEADWDLGELEPATDAADAAQLAAHSRGNKTSLAKQIQAIAQPALALWQRLLRGVRLRLPQVANLSDGLLSAILIGILVVLLVLINSLGHRSPTIATPAAPSTEINPSEQLTEPVPPSELGSPETNPDLERIADIQDQLVAVTTNYGSDLVASVQVSFGEDRLSANLSAGWYRLSRDQQDELAADLLGRSQLLAFATLELRDPDGVMVARSPVVGSTMVILQRQPPPEVPVPERPRYSITINR